MDMLAILFNPSPRNYRSSVSPLYRFTTQRRSVDSSRLSLLLDTFSACDKGYIQTPPLVFSVTGKEARLNSSPVFCRAKYRGGGEAGGVVCSFFSTARRTNQEAPPLLSGFFARSLLPPSGAAELAALKQSSPCFLRRLAPSRPDKGGVSCWTCWLFSSTPLLGTTVPRCLPYIVSRHRGEV